MILQALTGYYEDLVRQGKIASPGWTKTKIKYALCINSEGELEQAVPLLESTDSKKTRPQQFDLPAPVKRTVGVASNFLWDNSSYILGIDTKGKPQRSLECFEACKEMHQLLLKNVDSDVAGSILAFFEKWDPMKAKDHIVIQNNPDIVESGGNLLFRVNGNYAHNDERVREAWQKFYNNEHGEERQCLVTGRMDQIATVHPAIKGVADAQSSGASIVSFNAPAFCSYGREQGENAPVGKYAAFAYTAALNALLADRENVQRIGDTTIVCWAEGAEPQYQQFTFAALFGKTVEGITEKELRSIVKKLSDGVPVTGQRLDPDRPFYILGLSPNAARLSVRFFYQGTFGRLMENINAHHERMQIVRPSYDNYETIPIWNMLRETVNPNSRDKNASPILAGSVARAIFTGGLYPASLMEQTMLRIRSERKITRGRAAIIKAYYLRNENRDCPKEVLTVSLNENCTNPAYTLGRLFSVYEAVQDAANPGINTTIKDKYFNSAAATPATIFPLLNNLCQKHLRKLNKGSRIWYEKQIMELMSILGDRFPARLNLPQQGSFDLGYYHQTQKRFEKKGE